MFKNQPKGLFALALANTGERFGYYTMLAVFVLFLKENFGLSEDQAGNIYATFLAFVYFLPFIGGILADKFGYGRMVTIGIVTMFSGYLLMAWPLGTDNIALYAMYGALVLISIGTGLFKGNLQVMVGNLYDDPKYANKRDAAFSLFYMAINLGSLFAPSAASAMRTYALEAGWATTPGEAYHFAFAVACISLIFSILVYAFTRKTFKHVENGTPKVKTGETTVVEENPKDTKARIVALCLVFAVVIFFWMAFHQNGLTLTFFAEQFTNLQTNAGVQSMLFNVWNLVLIIIAVYAGFSIFQSENKKSKVISSIVVLASIAILCVSYFKGSDARAITAEMFQQFNPFYVVALTPVSMALFGWLASKGKEPSAPRKIALGMLVAALGFVVIAVASIGLNTPDVQKSAMVGAKTLVSSNWLISTYLVLTFAELLLSPMGISFVSKVAPAKYKGMMMGGWFVATAIGNYLTKIGSKFWGDMPLWGVWTIFIACCLLSAIFMFSVMKKLEKVTK
ncbi:MAG: peptide MFS transporter [Paludibacteraceae bacterium]|nr:peptide MFS transporter [Paludibacteraceae bacterium]